MIDRVLLPFQNMRAADAQRNPKAAKTFTARPNEPAVPRWPREAALPTRTGRSPPGEISVTLETATAGNGSHAAWHAGFADPTGGAC